MNDDIVCLLIGMVIGVCLVLLVVSASDMGDMNLKRAQAIEWCEMALPRNQHCEIVITARIAKAKD